ncbi:MAG: hypothetical protein NQ127_00815 [Candidatus Cardinium sp.]|nr:hypothetical protein [Candidatus Cardinium sp.]
MHAKWAIRSSFSDGKRNFSIKSKIATTAKSHVEDTDWAYGEKKDNFPANCWECNKFVHDVLEESGITPPTRTDSTGTYPIRAADWASSSRIKNWEYKGSNETWQHGDVIAKAFDQPNENASGHCGIAVSSYEVVAAGREEVYLRANDPNLPRGEATVRRYMDQ